MKSRIFCFILCCIFLLSLPCLASGSAETDGELVRISGGTTLYADADLTKAIGIFSSDVCVYAGEARASSAGEVIEIIYLRDFIVRYAYIPLLSAAPLTPSEKAAYAADSADGILIRPGITLVNIDLSPLPSAADSAILQDASAVPEQAEETALPSAGPVLTPAPVPAAAETFRETGADAPSNMAGSIALLPSGTPLYTDSGLSDIMGWLARDAYVYVNTDLTASGGGSIEIVFCRDYIIRYAYVSPSAAVWQDTADENIMAEDGITFKPGVILSNASVLDAPPVPGAPSEAAVSDSFPASEAPSETAAPPVTVSDASDIEAGNTIHENNANETSFLPADPIEEPSLPAEAVQPAADAGAPESAVPAPRPAETTVVSQYAEVRLKAVPMGKHYLLNAADPVPAGSMIRSITLYPMSTGNAEGTVFVLYLTDGKYHAAFSKDFSLSVPYGDPWKTIIPLDTLCENDAYVTVCFSSSCTARFSMAADESSLLRYFSEIGDDPLMLTTEGYAVNYEIRFE